jgi:hypothetical protein
MLPGDTVVVETRGEVEIFILREADIASAAYCTGLGEPLLYAAYTRTGAGVGRI